jgi:hypothetical protein
LRADVRDQILFISEPVLSKKILALQMQVPILHGLGGRRNLVTYLRSLGKRRWVCRPLPNDTFKNVSGAATAPVLPELRADVRDQIPLVVSEPVLSKILALRCEVPIHMDGEEGGTWSRTCEAFRDQRAMVP